ncbi:MAG: septation protein A [Nevskiaceae bacterium]|nr:MAG: septation protein A [Nevskiaceae bacterium]
MKFLLDLAPALAFFAAYYLGGIYVATGVLIAAMFALVLVYWLWKREVHKVHLVTSLVVAVFGGLTLYVHDPAFIKFKPTALYALFSAALLLSHVIGDRVLLARLPQQAIQLPEPVWRRVNFAWGLFFAFCAVLNLYVAAHYDEATWVKFKTFGFSALMFVFMLAHAPFLARYLPQE